MVSKIPINRMIIPEPFWMYAPNFLPFFINRPPAPRYHIRKIKSISGSAVPIANTDGRINPYDVVNTIGIKVTKNKINIVGQNAIEKLKPSINEPNGVSRFSS